MDAAADDLRATTERVEHDLKWSIWPHGEEVRPRAGLQAEDLESFGTALRSLKAARQALHPNTPGGVQLDKAREHVRRACEVFDLIPHWRIPDEVNAERATALRDLGLRMGAARASRATRPAAPRAQPGRGT